MDAVTTKEGKAAYMRAWNRSPAGIASQERRRKEHADYNREWNARNRERRRQQNRDSRNRNIDSALGYSRIYHENYRHKDQARKSVWTAISNGTLVRPDSCSDCLGAGKIEAHHHLGYDRQNWLNVQWLCIVCHRAADRKMDGIERL